MIDTAKIKVKAGSGGRGGVAFNPFPPFYREGGNGGRGGDVYVQGDRNLNTLTRYHMKTHFEAESGESGNRNKRNGKYGEDLVLKFPLGTQLFFENESVEVLNEELIKIFEGGRGGLGNAIMGSKFDKYATKPQEIRDYTEISLKLKVLGDIGLIGYPNAGKSSLINCITNAESPVGDYAFTTLEPKLGTLKYTDIVIVDLPGIIEGAAEGRGLGIKFLTHAERCKRILIVLDVSDNPLEIYQILQNEMNKFKLNKVFIVILNKVDQITRKNRYKIEQYFKNLNILYFCTSTIYKIGINNLITRLANIINKVKTI